MTGGISFHGRALHDEKDFAAHSAQLRPRTAKGCGIEGGMGAS